LVATIVQGPLDAAQPSFEGFAIHYDGLRESSDAKNLILALENPDVVDIKIKKELDAGRLPGPFIAHPFHPFRISP
ncbi:unnamed protein product, partial [Porites lobata]